MPTTSLLLRFMYNLTKKHLEIAKRVLRYIQGTIDFRIEYVKGKSAMLVGYCDNDWKGDATDMKSTLGYVFTFGSDIFA